MLRVESEGLTRVPAAFLWIRETPIGGEDFRRTMVDFGQILVRQGSLERLLEGGEIFVDSSRAVSGRAASSRMRLSARFMERLKLDIPGAPTRLGSIRGAYSIAAFASGESRVWTSRRRGRPIGVACFPRV